MAGLEELLRRLKSPEPEAADVAAFRGVLQGLTAALEGVFRIGKPIRKEERLRRAEMLVRLARKVASLRGYEPTAVLFASSLRRLEELADEAEEAASRFASIHKLPPPRLGGSS